MSKKKIILLSVLAVLVIAIAGVLIWQWNNVIALVQFVQHDEQTIEELLVQNDQQIEQVLEEYPELDLAPLDEETKQKLQEGSLTEEEIVEIITKQTNQKPTSGEKPNGDGKGSGTGDPAKNSAGGQNSGQTTQGSKPTSSTKTPTKSVEAANEEIAQLVARVYVIQADFLGRLANIEARAKAQINALPKSERTKERKIAIGRSYIGEMSALEAECDGQISAIVSRVRKLLTESGQKTTLADTIQKTYEREKSLKKAYYMNRYL